MSRHTRGPWTLGAIDPSGSRRIEALSGQAAICYVAPWEDPTEEADYDSRMESNALLIAAAPDLLRAARLCLVENKGSSLNSRGRYEVYVEPMQALASAVAKVGRGKPGPLEMLAQVHDEANLVYALDVALGATVDSLTHGGDIRVPAEMMSQLRIAYNNWKKGRE